MFPAECRVCEGPLERISTIPVCSMCVERIQPNVLMGCRRCGEAADLDQDPYSLGFEDSRMTAALAQGLECRVCRMAAPEFERAVFYGLYEDELRSLVHLLKFERLPAIAGLLGHAMAQAMLRLEPLAGRDLLVIAVPLVAARERQRGYNQSVLLARAALKRLKRLRPGWRLTPAHALLVRRRRTESQWVLAPRDRRRNLEGAFAVTGDVKGREIMLIDDILTSGATARECARALRRAGAARVWVATLARAQKASAVAQQQAEAQSARWDLPPAAANEFIAEGLPGQEP
jgi:ComF family protein